MNEGAFFTFEVPPTSVTPAKPSTSERLAGLPAPFFYFLAPVWILARGSLVACLFLGGLLAVRLAWLLYVREQYLLLVQTLVQDYSWWETSARYVTFFLTYLPAVAAVPFFLGTGVLLCRVVIQKPARPFLRLVASTPQAVVRAAQTLWFALRNSIAFLVPIAAVWLLYVTSATKITDSSHRTLFLLVAVIVTVVFSHRLLPLILSPVTAVLTLYNAPQSFGFTQALLKEQPLTLISSEIFSLALIYGASPGAAQISAALYRVFDLPVPAWRVIYHVLQAVIVWYAMTVTTMATAQCAVRYQVR